MKKQFIVLIFILISFICGSIFVLSCSQKEDLSYLDSDGEWSPIHKDVELGNVYAKIIMDIKDSGELSETAIKMVKDYEVKYGEKVPPLSVNGRRVS